MATRDCGHCLQFLYNEETGAVELNRKGEPTKRHFGCPPPCRTHRGCPKGTPEEPKGLSAKNQQAYLFHKECEAVGQFPDDPIVRQNARIIKAIEDMVAEAKRRELILLGVYNG